MSADFLDEDEIAVVTGKKRRPAQRRELNTLGITHKVRSDGSLLVSRAHVLHLLGAGEEKKTKIKAIEPNWKALNAT